MQEAPEKAGLQTVATRLQRLLYAVEDTLLVSLVAGLIALASAQIVLRNLFASGWVWADPLVRVLVLWVALIGAMVATREDHHIRIELLPRFLPPAAKSIAHRITDLFSSLVCGLLAWHGGRFVRFEWQDGAQLFAAVPAWLCESIIPVGFAVMALRFLLGAIARSGRERPRR